MAASGIENGDGDLPEPHSWLVPPTTTEIFPHAEQIMDNKLSRRKFIENAVLGAGATLTMGYLIAGCKPSEQAGGAAPEKGAAPAKAGGEFSCDDVTGLSDADKATRTSLQYVDKTPDPAKPCDGCALYTQSAAGAQCGGCTVVKGPIHPKGYCSAWAPKA